MSTPQTMEIASKGGYQTVSHPNVSNSNVPTHYVQVNSSRNKGLLIFVIITFLIAVIGLIFGILSFVAVNECNCGDIQSNESGLATSQPTNNPTSVPTKDPTKDPTFVPTFQPTIDPIITSEPTIEPTTEPTIGPTANPTYFDGYFIGDYKFSLQTVDHGAWKLCDAGLLDVNGPYNLLFNQIGFAFGGLNTSNITYFRLPNVSDSVIGVAGNNHPIGDKIGDESILLQESHIPQHRHPTIYWGPGSGGTSNYDHVSICLYGANYHLEHCGFNNFANGWSTGYQWYSGPNNAFSVMQPTTFISNLFIYTGVFI